MQPRTVDATDPEQPEPEDPDYQPTPQQGNTAPGAEALDLVDDGPPPPPNCECD